MKTTLFSTLPLSAFTKTTDTFNKNKRCHMTLEGLSSVCAKLDPASSKHNKILKINVSKNFAPANGNVETVKKQAELLLLVFISLPFSQFKKCVILMKRIETYKDGQHAVKFHLKTLSSHLDAFR